MNTETHQEPYVLRSDSQGIATLTLNRPQQFNSLSSAMIAALQSEVDAIATDPVVRVVVIAGAGKAFCAGHDLKEMRANPGKVFMQALFTQCGRMMMTLTRKPQPVIARIHGIATAAGCQLVSMCDLAVAADVARFATSGINVGLFCATPGSACRAIWAVSRRWKCCLPATSSTHQWRCNRAGQPCRAGRSARCRSRQARAIDSRQVLSGHWHGQTDVLQAARNGARCGLPVRLRSDGLQHDERRRRRRHRRLHRQAQGPVERPLVGANEVKPGYP